MACGKNSPNRDRMGLITHFEDIVGCDDAQARKSGLQIVDGLSHVSFCGEYQSFETRVGILDLFDVAKLQQPPHDLFVRQLRVPQDRTPRLDGVDDFVALVASQAESRRVRVDFHCPAQGLLCACSH